MMSVDGDMVILELGIAVEGDKDSLWMAAKVGEEVVKVPDTLVVWVYADCPDMALTITPTTLRCCSWTSLSASCVCSSTNPR